MRTLARLARRLYGTCDHIVVVSPAFKDFIRDRYGIEEKKIAVIENGVDIGLFKPQAKRPIGKERGRFVVSYIGTLGFAHGLETVIEAARILQNTTPDIAFVFVGEGAEKAGLMHLCSRYRLSNITFVGEQPRSLVPQWISESDVCLVVLKNAPIFKTVIPTKMLEFMACGRPVILSADGEARRLLEEAKAGMSVEPEKPAALAEAIRMLHGDAVLRSRFGDHGRAYIWRHLSREATASQYLTVLAAIIQNRNIPLRTVNTAPASVERLVERDISSVK
jgi:glycosyltransferase involved in cell wall biosynthesis